MKIQLIRNAALKINYGGQTFLVDPMLSPKGAFPGFEQTIRQELDNPIVDLPISIPEILEGVDAVILTHLHPDHWDEVAAKEIAKDTQILTTFPEFQDNLIKQGFTNVQLIAENSDFEGIQLNLTECRHGNNREALELYDPVAGVVFKHPHEDTLYLASDTIWYDGVEDAIETHQPEVIVLNAGKNMDTKLGAIIMGEEDVRYVYLKSPQSQIICVHMEAVNHWGLSRDTLKQFIKDEKLSTVQVPEDGEIIGLS